jgi:hypothetical protein
MEEQVIKKEKSLLEKMAPFVLVVLLVVLAYFGLSKLKLGGSSGSGTVVDSFEENTSLVQVDVDFLNSDAFKNLKFIPDSSAFDPVTGTIPAGRDDPFAPVY